MTLILKYLRSVLASSDCLRRINGYLTKKRFRIARETWHHIALGLTVNALFQMLIFILWKVLWP